MRRAALATIAASALVGCPIPQPLPDYPAGTVTPPRIVVDQIAWPETVVRVPAACATAPRYDLAATLIDVNTIEVVRARWFINYSTADSARYMPEMEVDIPGVDANPPVTERVVPIFTFHPYDGFPTLDGTGGGSGRNAGAVHIVELVVSNGFDPGADDGSAPLPYRTPLVGFETQVYRWMFLTVAESPAVPCPP